MAGLFHDTQYAAAAGRRGWRGRCRRRAALCALLLSVAWPALGAEAGVEELRVAFMDGVFSGLNRTDAMASIKAWIESVAALRGYHKEGVVTIYADLDALRAAVADGQVHMAALQSDEWLRVKGSCALMPVFIPTIGATLYDQILLLVRRDAGLDDLAQLRGATVAAHNTAGRGLGELWLDHELRMHALPERDRFFRATETVDKSSAAVLAVFFGKAQACLVSRKAFDIAAELNPQLAQQLQPLLVSPDIVGSVICVWGGDWPHKQDLLAALAELHQSVQGRQILAVFRTDRLAPYDPTAFQGVETMMDRGAGAQAPVRVELPAGSATRRQLSAGLLQRASEGTDADD